MENTWESWMEMAQDSQLAAWECSKAGRDRSAASRAYYAAYQAATAAIHYAQRSTPPTVRGQQREAWQHDPTPFILETDLANIIKQQDDRKKLRSVLGELYKIRIQADYVASYNLFDNAEIAREANKNMNFVIKSIQGIFPRK